MTDRDPPSTVASLAIDRGVAPLRRRPPLWRRAWVWLLVLAAAGAAAAIISQRGRPIAVEIATVASAYPSQTIAVLNATGRVVAARRASVSSKATGRLEWLGVQEGQRVAEGEVIARLENRDVAASRDQAAAGVKVAEANLVQGQAEQADAAAALKRARELAQKEFVAEAAVDTAEARFNKAQAAIRTLEAQIALAQANLRAATVSFDQTQIRAPFNGVVLTKNANVGDILTPFSSASGTIGAVVTMADMSTLEVEADVSEASIAKITVGQPAEIQLDAFPALRLAGSVSRIVPTVDRSKATLLVKVKFDETDPRALPDMSAKIAFLSRPLVADERMPVPAVRPEAVLRAEGREVVFVVRQDDGAVAEKGAAGGGRATRTDVRTGGRIGELVRIEGLAPGTRVVVNPPAALADGAPVAPAKR